jgi:hypothetical protein
MTPNRPGTVPRRATGDATNIDGQAVISRMAALGSAP